MSYGIYKVTYRGRAIYWHPGHGYGDETLVIAPTLAECRAKIDESLERAERERPDHLKYWDTLSPNERTKWRKLCIASELSASELAYTNRPTAR